MIKKIKDLFKTKEIKTEEKKVYIIPQSTLEKGSFVYCSFGQGMINEDFGIITDIIEDYYIIELQQQHKGKWVSLPKANIEIASRC